jgi:hypothetical protein
MINPARAGSHGLQHFVTLCSVAVMLLACSSSSPSDPKPDSGRHGPDASDGFDAAQLSDAGSRPRSDAGRPGSKDAGTKPATSDSGREEDASEPSTPRKPLLATSGAQLRVTGERLGLQLTAANLVDDADVFAVHQEFYGIPWSAFEASTAPPAEWDALMHELAAQAMAAHKPVFLSISMLNGARQRLAATTRIDAGQVKTSDDTTAPCYDFATASDAASKRKAYLRYVEAMVELFQPAFVNLAIEVNLFFEKCPAAAPGLVEVINAAYDAAKAKRSQAVVFPSFQIDHLYGYSKDSCPDASQRAKCFDDHYAQLAGIKRDRFAMSSYPFLDQISTPSALPADWFERGAKRGKEQPLIAETGWLATPLAAKLDAGTCTRVFEYDDAASEAYLRRVLGDAARLEMDLVTWWSDRDLVPIELMTNCPCDFDATWCSVLEVLRGPAVAGTPEARFYNEVLLKAFGTMGLRRYDGTPRAGHIAAWAAAR